MCLLIVNFVFFCREKFVSYILSSNKLNLELFALLLVFSLNCNILRLE